MKNNRTYLLYLTIILLLSSVAMSGCNKSDQEPVTPPPANQLPLIKSVTHYYEGNLQSVYVTTYDSLLRPASRVLTWNIGPPDTLLFVYRNDTLFSCDPDGSNFSTGSPINNSWNTTNWTYDSEGHRLFDEQGNRCIWENGNMVKYLPFYGDSITYYYTPGTLNTIAGYPEVYMFWSGTYSKNLCSGYTMHNMGMGDIYHALQYTFDSSGRVASVSDAKSDHRDEYTYY